MTDDFRAYCQHDPAHRLQRVEGWVGAGLPVVHRPGPLCVEGLCPGPTEVVAALACGHQVRIVTTARRYYLIAAERGIR